MTPPDMTQESEFKLKAGLNPVSQNQPYHVQSNLL
jgi:hypothetical protein